VTQIDFHIIENKESAAHLSYACKLVRKAYKNGYKAYVRTENEQEMNQLDKLLWTFSELDFIPHTLLESENEQEPVIIGMIGHEGDSRTVLINLSTKLTENYSSYSRVFELISNNPASIAAGRDRYRAYRKMNDELSNHHVTAN
jgi:DNA polymerase-3 subunit chi